MKLLPSLVMFASAVSACSDPAYRCKNPEGSKSGDYSRTTEICAEISNGASMCYCYAAAEYYCYLQNGVNVQMFVDSCRSIDPWYAEAC
jgi:hypothetical protein